MIKTVKFLGFGVVLGGLMAAAVNADVGLSPQQISYFDLPGQALQSSLVEFAIQARVTVVADSRLIASYRSGPVVGPQPVDKALSGLLANTPLAFRFDADTATFIIQQKPSLPDADPAEPVPVAKPAMPILDEVVVTSASYPFRYHTVTNTHLHGGMSYFDSSRFLNVVPRALVEDQQAKDIGDALKFVSGVTPGDGVTDSNDDVFIRGFQRHAIYIDGFRLSDSTGVKQLPANVERIDIIKGPSTLLYGQAEPGGVVNVVRKRPQDETFISAEVGGGSSGRRFASLDMNGQLPGPGDVDVRLILADDAQDEQADITDVHRQLIAGSLKWEVTPDTIIDMGYEYQQASQQWDRNFLIFNAYEDIFPGASLGASAKQARPDFTTDYTLFDAAITHYFSPDWRLRAKYVWHDEERLGIRTTSENLLTNGMFFKREELGNDFAVFVLGGQVAIPLVIYPQSPEWLFRLGKLRSIYDEQAFETENNVSLNLEGSFTTGGLTHHLTLGADWHQQDLYKQYTIEARDLFPNLVLPESEFVAILPQLAEVMFDPSQPLGELEYKELRLLYDDVGFYLHDSIELSEQWTANIGTRYNIITGDYTDITEWAFTELETYEHFSSQFGLVYKPVDNHSIYLNYSEAMRANYHLDEVGPQLADPELSDQVEVGVKSLLFNGRLLSTIGIYEINKRNIIDVQVIEGFRTLLQSHEQQVRGVDMDITWQVSSQFDLVGALSLSDPLIVSGENQGNQPALAAEQTASMFASYRWQNGLSLNGGYKYVSQRYAEDANAFWLGEYSTLDLGVSYTFTALGSDAKVQLSVNNALDERYYTAILGGLRMNESEGRTILGSLRVDI